MSKNRNTVQASTADNARSGSKTQQHGKVIKPLKSSASSAQQNGDKKRKISERLGGLFAAATNNYNQSNAHKKASTHSGKASTRNKGVYTSHVSRRKKSAAGASERASLQADGGRFWFIWLLCGLFFVALAARAMYIQVLNADFFQQQGEKWLTGVRDQPAYRGMITDRNQLPLAVSAPLVTVVFSPYDYARDYYAVKKALINSKEGSSQQRRHHQQLQQMDLTRLAAAANVPVAELKKAVHIDEQLDLTAEDAEDKVAAALPAGKGSHYFPLLVKVTPEIADSVISLDFVGVYDETFYQRYYPQPQPNAQLLGFMGHNAKDTNSGYQGRAGIERQFEQQLAGDMGKVLVLKDARQDALKDIKQLEPEVAGQNITLTIDARLQYLLYKELEKVGRLQRARWSTGMVVDVQTGEVLAMSTWPSFNSNNLNEMTGVNQRNRAVVDVFEPGSVMKPFTVAAALNSGKFSEHSLIDTTPGSIQVNGYTIRDHGNLGRINFATLLQKSSNVASTKIAFSLPADAISRMQQQFGFGEKTALNFPGELAGITPTPNDKQMARRATVSYGYGLQVTLAQVAQAYAALAAGGVMHPLTLVATDKPAPSRRIMNHDQAMAIVQMMELVTHSGGTGVSAAIDGYRVAGKTGTSRRNNPKGGYYTDQYRTLFAGMAPASNPRLVTVILVEDPREQQYAGQVAAPVFHNVMKEGLRLYNVPFDKPLKAK